MDWFKHDTTSIDDPDILEAEDLFGDAGYSVFFKMLEIYGKDFSHLKKDKLTISIKVLRRKLRKSYIKVEKILRFYQEKNRIFFKINDNHITFEIPKYIEKASNWTKRHPPQEDTPPTEAPTEAPTAIEEEEEEEDKEETTMSDEDFYLTKKKRKLQGKRLITFKRFWKAFNYKDGKAEAADAWLDIPKLTNELVDEIVNAAEIEAELRPGLLAKGKTPKMAQGWLNARRWEDEKYKKKPSSPTVSKVTSHKCVKCGLPAYEKDEVTGEYICDKCGSVPPPKDFLNALGKIGQPMPEEIDAEKRKKELLEQADSLNEEVPY